MLSLVDLFVVGAIVHFCLLGLRLVRYIEQESESQPVEEKQ